MADFNQPINTGPALGMIDALKAQIASVAKMFNGTSDTNTQDGFIQYDEAAIKWKKKTGATWSVLNFHTWLDAALAAISTQAVEAPGVVKYDAADTPPAGWLACDGATYNVATYPLLHARIGYKYGGSGGTFQVPNCKARFILGCDTTIGATVFKDLGEKAGSLDHTHTTPNHQHTIPTHSHTMGNHTHSTPSHTHSVPAHSHSVPGHYHDANLGGADIQIISSGSHQHTVQVRTGGAIGSNVDVLLPASAGASGGPGHTINDSTSAHTHPHSSIIGTVGYKNGGISGDGAMATATDGSTTTGSSGGTSGTPSTNNTDASGVLTSNSGEGSGTSGAANPAYIILNCIIKT